MPAALQAVIRVVYQLIFTVLLLLASPFLVLKMLRRGQWRESFGQRFGFYGRQLKERLAGRDIVWLNAVSVGEVNLTARLVTLLREREPGITLVVSTTTTTGMIELRRKLPDEVIRLYYPLDLRSAVRRAMTALRPRAILLVEADFWPNLLWEARAEGIPVLLVNALISERSARRYRRFSLLFQPLFASFDRVFCADETDAGRLVLLGCRAKAVKVVGHPKFDTSLPPDPSLLDVRAMLASLALPHTAPVLLGGSTHSGEEALLARIYLALKVTHPELFLVIVPRHFERAGEVVRELLAIGLTPILRTALPATPPDLSASPHCLIVDTTGELRHFYSEADIVYVGQSFVAGGGQNPIEPAVQGKAILSGPQMETFKSILPAFLKAGALIQVRNPAELEAAVRDLLEHPEQRRAMGLRARAVVEANRGALERTVESLVNRLRDSRAVPPAPIL